MHGVDLGLELGIYAYDAYILEAARSSGFPLLALDGPIRRKQRSWACPWWSWIYALTIHFQHGPQQHVDTVRAVVPARQLLRRMIALCTSVVAVAASAAIVCVNSIVVRVDAAISPARARMSWMIPARLAGRQISQLDREPRAAGDDIR